MNTQFDSVIIELILQTAWAFVWKQQVQVQAELRKYWDVFYIWMKWKLKAFQIKWANFLFTIEHR